MKVMKVMKVMESKESKESKESNESNESKKTNCRTHFSGLAMPIKASILVFKAAESFAHILPLARL